jgi:hypothetical protein
VRRFVFARAEGILAIEDRFELEESGTFETIVICQDPTRASGNQVLIEAPGAMLIVSPDKGLRLEAAETCPYRTHSATDGSVTRLRFAAREPAAAGAVSYRIQISG